MNSNIYILGIDSIDPPLRQIRTSWHEEDLQALADSIERHGLLQPVVVRDLGNNRYRIIAGMRRYLAIQRLGWKEITGSVRECTDQEEEEMLLHENLQREDVAPLDEARWIEEHMHRYGITMEVMAHRAKCSVSRISQLVSLLHGDPKVTDALVAERISKAQALAINRIRDEYGRVEALQWAIHQGMSAAVITRWAQDREEKGIAGAVESIDWDGIVRVQQAVKNQAKCVLHDDWVEYAKALWLVVCQDCWDAALFAIEAAQRAQAAESQAVSEDGAAERLAPPPASLLPQSGAPQGKWSGI